MQWPVTPELDPSLKKSFEVLRAKWGEVPGGRDERIKTSELVPLSDAVALETWTRAYLDSCTGDAFSIRGWYQEIYKDVFRGKKVLDVGCGMGIDTIFYAQNGATVWFTDIVAQNVEFVRRICSLKGLKDVHFLYLQTLSELDDLPYDFDVIYCCGSLINAPLDLTRIEVQKLLCHLPVGGRWVELAYPKVRWEREGRLPFSQWGAKTDGGAPWMEWKDLEKLRWLFEPATFEAILALDFHNSDFNWFDLLRRS